MRRKGDKNDNGQKLKYLFEIITLFVVILLFPSTMYYCLFKIYYIYFNFCLFIAHSVVLMLHVALQSFTCM